MNNVKKIGFTLAHSSFYSSLKKDKHFELVCFAISKEGRIMAKIDKDHLRSSNNDILGLNKCLKYKRDIRDHKQKVSIDEAIVLDLS